MAVRRILEGTKYDKQASEMLAKSGLFDAETSDKIIEGLFRTDIPAFHGSGHNWLEKYLKGIVRMIIEEADGDPRKAQSFLEECPAVFNDYLTWVKAERPKIGNSLDTEFNEKMHYQDVVQKVEEIQEELHKKSQEELANMEFSNSNYTLVPIDSYEQMHKLYGGRKTGDGSSDAYAGGGGTAWCHTNDIETYERWTKGGNKFFVLQSNNWEDIPFNAETNRETEGKDAYGNSLIAILVSKYGMLKNATTRSNHVGDPADADHQYKTYAELSKIAGFNVQNEVEKYVEENPYKDTPFEVEDDFLKGFRDDINVSEITSISIPKGIAKIDSMAFENCTNLKEVIIPEGVWSIGSGAFAGCQSLEKVVLPESITYINTGAFKKCESLKSIKIPSLVSELKSYAFANCFNLEEISLPDNLISVNANTFYGCASLKSFEAPSALTYIEEYAFSKCDSLKDVKLNPKLDEIGYRAFSECSNLETIDIPDNVTFIGAEAFSLNPHLKAVKLPNKLDIIREKTFFGCKELGDLYIPDSVKEIEDLAFRYCEKLNITHMPEDVKVLDSKAFLNTSYVKEGEDLIIIENQVVGVNKASFSGKKKVVIPEGITALCDRLFFDDDYLSSVVLPDSLKRIGRGCFTNTFIEEINLPEGLEHIGESAFYGTSLKTVKIPHSIKHLIQGTFSNCSNLSNVELNEGLASIGQDCFRNTYELKHINIPNTVTEIGTYAFKGSGLEELTIPEGVLAIKENAFEDCPNLKKVTLSNSVFVWGEAFTKCRNLKDVYMYKDTRYQLGAFDSWIDGFTVHWLDGTNESYNRNNKLSLYEGDEDEEIYKLDIQVEYSIVDKDADYVVDEGTVLDALGQIIEEKIADNKEYICRGNKFSNFDIEYTNCNEKSGILTFEIVFDFMIIGKYFIDKVEYLLRNYSANIEYKGTTIEVQVDSVFPMLRHIN